MTIKQIWMVNRELYEIIIDGKDVYYKDRKMPVPTRMIPMDNKIKRQIIMSRNKIDKNLINQFNLTKEEEEEYKGAITEEELAEICKKDCLKNGSILQKEIKNGNT